MTHRYFVPKFTIPRKCFSLTKGIDNSTFKWNNQTEGVPCRLKDNIEENGYVVLNSFNASSTSFFRITTEVLSNEFDEIVPDEHGFLRLEAYPSPIHESEFTVRDRISKLQSKLNTIKSKLSPSLREIFNAKVDQLFQSKGDTKSIKIANLFKEKKDPTTGIKRVGSPVFNRSCRWSPPTTLSYDAWKKTRSFPAPVGIRPTCFSLPSNLYTVVIEMITQIVNFQHISVEDLSCIQTILPEIKKRDVHCCTYCNKAIDTHLFTSQYKSSKNYIEICHRDPDKGFTRDNMYWGHGECNRIQGGFSEKFRILDGFYLALKEGIIGAQEYDQLKSRFN